MKILLFAAHKWLIINQLLALSRQINTKIWYPSYGCDFYRWFCRRLLSAVSITAFTARRGCLDVSCPHFIVAQKKTKAAVPAALKSRGYPPTEKITPPSY